MMWPVSEACKCKHFNAAMFFVASRRNKTLTKKEKRTMTEYSDYIQDIVKTKKVRCIFWVNRSKLFFDLDCSNLKATIMVKVVFFIPSFTISVS